MTQQQGMTFKCVLSYLLFAWIMTDVRGQFVEDGVLSETLYVSGYEQACATPIQEYMLCVATGESCIDENLALLTCTNNCPSEVKAAIDCVLFDMDCTMAILQWNQCSLSRCAGEYLVPYADCMAEQKTKNQEECSSCPYMASGESSELLSLSPPSCSVFEEDYCTWQSCCEPCQYYLNFYGKCMQTNFGTCDNFLNENPNLPTCPLQIENALPPSELEAEEEEDVGDGSTNGDTNENQTKKDSAFLEGGYSRMTWISILCGLLLLFSSSCLLDW